MRRHTNHVVPCLLPLLRQQLSRFPWRHCRRHLCINITALHIPRALVALGAPTRRHLRPQLKLRPRSITQRMRIRQLRRLPLLPALGPASQAGHSERFEPGFEKLAGASTIERRPARSQVATAVRLLLLR